MDALDRIVILNQAFEFILNSKQYQKKYITFYSNIAGLTTDKKLRATFESIANIISEFLNDTTIHHDEKILLSMNFQKLASTRNSSIFRKIFRISASFFLDNEKSINKAINECEKYLPYVSLEIDYIYECIKDLDNRVIIIKEIESFLKDYYNFIDVFKIKGLSKYITHHVKCENLFLLLFNFFKLVNNDSKVLFIQRAKSKLKILYVLYPHITKIPNEHDEFAFVVQLLWNSSELFDDESSTFFQLFHTSKKENKCLEKTIDDIFELFGEDGFYFCNFKNFTIWSSLETFEALSPIIDYSKRTKNTFFLNHVLKNLPSVLPKNRSLFCKSATYFNDYFSQYPLLIEKSIQSLIKNNNEEFIKFEFLKKFNSENLLVLIFEFFRSHTIIDPEGLLDCLFLISIIKENIPLELIHNILLSLDCIIPEKRKKAIGCVFEVQTTTDEEIDIILNTFCNMPAEHWNGSIEYARKLAQCLGCKFSIHLVRVFGNAPCKEWEALFLNAREFYKKTLFKQHFASAFFTYLSIEKDKRDILLETIHTFYQRIYERADLDSLYITLSSMPNQDELGELITSILGLNSKSLAIKILNKLYFIAPENRANFIEHVADQRNQLNISFRKILNIFYLNKQVQENGYKFLGQLLSNEETPAGIFTIANHIFKYQNELGLDDEHPLLQKSIQCIIISNPEELQNPKNPYRIYHELQQFVQKEKDILFNVPLNQEFIEGNFYQWKLQRASERPKLKYTIKDLPRGISENTLDELFNKFNKRIILLNKETQKAIHQEILDSSEKDFSSLWNNLTEDPFIDSLLNINLECIKPAQVYLYRILKAIQDQFLTFTSKNLLSQGEEMLIKFSLCIQKCKTGRYDGLIRFYNFLPIEYRFKNSPDPLETVWNAKYAIHCSLQKVFNLTLSDETFITEVVGFDGFGEASHVTLFLENRLGNHIWLENTIKFDPHTFVLPDSLLEKEITHLLRIYFSHCKIEKGMQQLISDSNILIKENIFEGLVQLIKETINTDFDYNSYFEYNEQTNDYLLTKKGALVLLQAANYIEKL